MGHLELIDLILQTHSAGISVLLNGNYVGWCAAQARISEYLKLLKDGISKDAEANKKTVDDLKRKLRESGVEVIEKESEG